VGQNEAEYVWLLFGDAAAAPMAAHLLLFLSMLAATVQASLTRVVNQRLQALSEAGGVLGPGRGYAVSSLPEAVLKQVTEPMCTDCASHACATCSA
jgi:hypothetical protein